MKQTRPRERAALLLKAIYEAAYELDVAEDFGTMPCQHACCAPADWDAYQALRQQLHDAILTYRDRAGLECLPEYACKAGSEASA